MVSNNHFRMQYLWLLLISFLLLGTAGPDPASALQTDVPLDQALVLAGGESTNPREYDPATTHGSGDKLVFSGLGSFDPALNLIPDLADSWDILVRTGGAAGPEPRRRPAGDRPPHAQREARQHEQVGRLLREAGRAPLVRGDAAAGLSEPQEAAAKSGPIRSIRSVQKASTPHSSSSRARAGSFTV